MKWPEDLDYLNIALSVANFGLFRPRTPSHQLFFHCYSFSLYLPENPPPVKSTPRDARRKPRREGAG
eukprot:703305-Rhodomonas_salina.1